MNSSEVLFWGRGSGAVTWYRTGSPAFYLGSDWATGIGEPGDIAISSALKRGGMELPDFEKYTIVVLQQVFGEAWRKYIVKLRMKGIIVLYEIDDWLHGVRKIKGHAAQDIFTKDVVSQHELCMAACDGIICSTEWLAEAYSDHGKTYVCKNAIEADRYKDLEVPERQEDKVHVGWAGGEGHQTSIAKWRQAIQNVVGPNDQTRFVSIGLELANSIDAPGRTLALPFVPIENVPAVLCNIDIGLAPATDSKFFRAKSDLRWLEFGALGIPIIADPLVYPEIEDGVTGALADTQEEAEECMNFLIANESARQEIGSAVRSHIVSERCMEVAHEQWINVFLDVTR